MSQNQFFHFARALFEHIGYFSNNNITLKDPNRDDFNLYNLFLWNGITCYLGRGMDLVIYNSENNASVLNDNLILQRFLDIFIHHIQITPRKYNNYRE